jgi:(1->4)-alpha-D-glucan 1-alpha-D-glucosylmutase
LKNSPGTMLTTSTHDTKRSEDVRNRLNVLSEMPGVWAKHVGQWQQINREHKRQLEDGRVAPDGNEEYLLYQTILGAWPWDESPAAMQDFLHRLKEYATKALSEAKINLSWLNPDQAYVDAVHAFLTDILSLQKNGEPSPFVASLHEILPELRLFGVVNSLAQLVLKTASPGVPDFYQGTELWDLSLVDPDNRRPVDYSLRQSYLDAMRSRAAKEGTLAVVKEITNDLSDGRIKLWTMHRALKLRNQQPELFRHGSYKPLRLNGDKQENLIAFTRTHQNETVLALMPRFSYSLMKGQSRLPLGEASAGAVLMIPELKGQQLRNVFTDERVTVSASAELRLGEAFQSFPVALFTTRLGE